MHNAIYREKRNSVGLFFLSLHLYIHRHIIQTANYSTFYKLTFDKVILRNWVGKKNPSLGAIFLKKKKKKELYIYIY